MNIQLLNRVSGALIRNHSNPFEEHILLLPLRYAFENKPFVAPSPLELQVVCSSIIEPEKRLDIQAFFSFINEMLP